MHCVSFAAKLLSDAKDRVFDDLAGMFQHLGLVLTRRKKILFHYFSCSIFAEQGTS